MATFCTHCGSRFPNDAWPRHCSNCGEFTYRNPLPVAIALVPVLGGGLVVVRRDIEPRRGELCLPGGFMEFGEPWQESVTRELREETTLEFDPASVRLHTVRSTPTHLVVFGLLPEISALPDVTTEEASEITVISAPTELAFPDHTRVAAEFLSTAVPADNR